VSFLIRLPDKEMCLKLNFNITAAGDPDLTVQKLFTLFYFIIYFFPSKRQHTAPVIRVIQIKDMMQRYIAKFSQLVLLRGVKTPKENFYLGIKA